MASSVLGNGSAYSDRYKVIRQQQSALKTQSQVALLTEKGQTLSDLRKENTKRRKALELERKRKEEQEQAKRIVTFDMDEIIEHHINLKTICFKLKFSKINYI